MDVFEQAFAFVAGHEGGYTAAAIDPGNWTGGRCGAGECRGTHWGISAAACSQLDIRALTGRRRARSTAATTGTAPAAAGCRRRSPYWCSTRR